MLKKKENFSKVLIHIDIASAYYTVNRETLRFLLNKLSENSLGDLIIKYIDNIKYKLYNE